jgi:hypothetical protein
MKDWEFGEIDKFKTQGQVKGSFGENLEVNWPRLSRIWWEGNLKEGSAI